MVETSRMAETPIYTIHDLASYTGVNPRRIRSWIEKGVVPRAYNNKPHPERYGDAHLRAIREVLEIKDQQVTLRDLAERKGYKPEFRDWEDDESDEDPVDRLDVHTLVTAINDRDEEF